MARINLIQQNLIDIQNRIKAVQVKVIDDDGIDERTVKRILRELEDEVQQQQHHLNSIEDFNVGDLITPKNQFAKLLLVFNIAFSFSLLFISAFFYLHTFIGND